MAEELVADADRRDIAASLAGDEAAYARLIARYQAPIAAQMRRFARDRRAVEELTHDVFVEAYYSLRGFKGQAPFLHWLRRIATRAGYRSWKRAARERQRAETLEFRREELLNAPEDATPSEAAEYLYHVLETLPPKERLVLTLLYFEGCDTQEIAERAGWSRTLVKVRAYRARQKLRLQLENAGYGR